MGEMGKTFKVVNGDISDGYHTFDELYEHRIALYLALAKASGWRALYRQDYETWFCLYLETPKGQVSYHLPNSYLEMVKTFAELATDEYKWDGHTSAEVLERLKV
jgi:hypothetical protein